MSLDHCPGQCGEQALYCTAVLERGIRQVPSREDQSRLSGLPADLILEFGIAGAPRAGRRGWQKNRAEASPERKPKVCCSADVVLEVQASYSSKRPLP
mmetsp:Transcript_102903/g.300248  ORF Transcript_102903/g.300248 Transcript_102903/m.300248 type:complete len:98 (+) Transcript_102903:63-356(+)